MTSRIELKLKRSLGQTMLSKLRVRAIMNDTES